MGIPDSGKEYMCNAAKTGSWRTDILRIFRKKWSHTFSQDYGWLTLPPLTYPPPPPRNKALFRASLVSINYQTFIYFWGGMLGGLVDQLSTEIGMF